ncbi:MAG: SurA N-terminal domain-containing protein [Roseibacillus sp.]
MLRFFIFLSLLTTLAAKEFQITAIAAKVNGHAITKKEVEGLLAPRREMLQAMYPRQGEIYQRRLKEFRDKILEQLINNELLLSEVEGKGNIPDHIVEQEIARIIRENYDGKEEKFNTFLRENGLTRRSFREQQREQILVQAYRSQQFGDIAPPTEAEIKAKYQERKVAMRDRTKDSIDFRKIFLIARDRLDPNVTPESQLALAEQIHLELEGGADFTELAKKHSNGAFASEGGLQEGAKRTDFTMSFGDALFEESKAGDLVGPLTDPAGFTIVKILKIHYGPAPPLSDKEVKERMKKEVNIEKRTEKYDKWIKTLKEHAMIDIRE